jgi:Acetyltransferase (GNAT) domain
MSAAIQIRPRVELERDKWDAFVEASDEAWLWHRVDLIEALALWPGYQDLSFSLLDMEGRLLAVMPLHRIALRIGGIVRLVRLASLGGPACAANLSAAQRAKVLSELRDHLLRLLAEHNALAVEAQIAPLTPSLVGPAPPKVNPLIHVGFHNTQAETWIVDLTKTPEEIRRRYSESSRQELRKASRSEIRVREAMGPKDLENYYRLHLETYARTGAKPHPVAYFQAIFEKFVPRGLARILLAERSGKVVAAQNTGLYKAGAIYWTGASASQRDSGENRLLLDAQIMAARDSGFTRYETGQAFVNSRDAKERGLSHFKRSFGAEMHSFYKGVIHSPRLSFRIAWGFREMTKMIRGKQAW